MLSRSRSVESTVWIQSLEFSIGQKNTHLSAKSKSKSESNHLNPNHCGEGENKEAETFAFELISDS